MNDRIQKAIENDAAARRAKPVKQQPNLLPVKEGELYTEQFTRFINFKPSEAQKEVFNGWLEAADIWGLLDRAGDDGFKLTVKFDETTKAYNALLMDRRKSSPVRGCILSVRASTFSMAIARLVFVHATVAGKDWENLSLPVEEDW